MSVKVPAAGRVEVRDDHFVACPFALGGSARTLTAAPGDSASVSVTFFTPGIPATTFAAFRRGPSRHTQHAPPADDLVDRSAEEQLPSLDNPTTLHNSASSGRMWRRDKR